MEEILTANEVANRLKVHLMTVYRWIASGRIPVRRLPGGGVRIDAKALDKLLSEDTKGTTTKPRRGIIARPKK